MKAIIVLASIICAASAEAALPSPSVISPRLFSPNYTACGGIVPIQHNQVIGIQYKDEVTYSPNEFCVWTIYPHENIQSVDVRIVRAGFESVAPRPEYLDDGLTVYYWDSTGLHERPIRRAEEVASIPASRLFIAFSTGPDSPGGQGFSITVTGRGELSGKRGPPAFFLSESEGEFSYPSDVGKPAYGNNEKVSIVLQGQTTGVQKLRQVLLSDVDIELNDDYVEIYILNPYVYGIAGLGLSTKIGSFSGQSVGPLWDASVYSEYPVLYLFTSDARITAAGFKLKWTELL
jgi:hypothetical protein